MNKYSQSGQDEWVLSIIKHKGYFLDMGAYDGVHYSNTLLLEENGWYGLCVEPNPNNFKLLMKNRHCLLSNTAITPNESDIFLMSDEGSSSQRSIEGEIVVSCATIRTILKERFAPKYIDYISSDLERMDAEVWETFPFDEYSFGLATVEHCLYEGGNDFKERIMKVMLRNGYLIAQENVEHDGNKFEDWFINPKLIV